MTCVDCGSSISRRSQRCRRCARVANIRGVRKRIRPLAERLWARVEQRGECLIWTGYTKPSGHGHISRGPGLGLVLTHVAAWELVYGPVPPGKELHHTCITPACVNVTHLESLTPAEHAAAHAALRTTCFRGHPFDGVRSTTGRRYCRTCTRARNQSNYLLRKKALMNTQATSTAALK